MRRSIVSRHLLVWLKLLLVLLIGGTAVYYIHDAYQTVVREKEVLRQIADRLRADSRIAEVIVSDVSFNPITRRHQTTIKFLEYDVDGKPLSPRSFTFSGNIIQFQSLVVRFDDEFVMAADRLKGKSVYLFWKAFMLKGAETEEYVITPVDEVPEGYKIQTQRPDLEEEIWSDFWEYALDADKAQTRGIKNAQIEAPGMKFVPGMIYTLKIEHDGGIRIDVRPIPDVLRGEVL